MTNELLLRSKRVGSLQHSFLEVCSTASLMCETFFKLILQKENFSGFYGYALKLEAFSRVTLHLTTGKLEHA